MGHSSALILCLLLKVIAGRDINTRNQYNELQQNIVAGNETREPDETQIHFYMWTRETGAENHVEVDFDMATLYANGYDPNEPTILVCHGFSSEGAGFGRQIAKAYLEVGKFNVFSIDWEKLAMWYDYFGAAKRTKFVGDHAASLIRAIADNGGMRNVHLVGHSLGAHVVGFIGKKIQELGYGKLPRITGLDPAFPAFELAGPQNRIDKEDAELVDIIHTNSGFLWEGCLSTMVAIGHYDFFPAGGSHQPGCTDLCVVTACNENDINDLIKGGCSHSRAVEYFVESVNLSSATSFMAWQCDSWESFQRGECCQSQFAHMGLHLDRYSPEGVYYLMTAEEAPFSLGENGNFC
eukprot:TRINITY_DN7785_c0_g1_i5.p1 TRINITY_DN7785_c0_g1~~TRINITY_DN7785_c0_g1_i5.p1  ORF type:complete len:358 (-),score=46.80 TRINITY_DN7785_c0_g1_i5:28-1080(-)